MHRALLTIAWRNVWRQPRRTVLTVATVSAGLALLLVSIGLGDGAHEQMIDSAVGFGSGHVVFQSPGYQATGRADRMLDEAAEQRALNWIESVRSRFGVRHVVVRCFCSGLAASASDAAGVLAIGIDPAAEQSASAFADKIVEGSFPDAADGRQSVLGEGVARKLGLKLGERMVLTAQAAGGKEIESTLLRMGGVFRSGIEDLDHSLILVPITTIQHFLRMHGGIHQVAVVLADSRRSEAMASAGQRALPGLEVLSWKQALPELRDFILVDDAGNYLFNFGVFILIAFLVLNTLLMSVLERGREFGLLEALGLTPRLKFAMILLEAALIAGVSCVAGLAVGYAGHSYFRIYGLSMDRFYSGDITAAGVAFDPVIRSSLSATRMAGSVALVFVLTLLLSLLPARRAARQADPHLLGRT